MTPPSNTPDQDPLRGPTGRILVVDDERVAGTALEALLREDGFKTTLATNPFRALSLMGAFQPDVVLTDFRMPGLNGLEFMARVREAWPETVSVVMTAYASTETAVEAVKRG